MAKKRPVTSELLNHESVCLRLARKIIRRVSLGNVRSLSRLGLEEPLERLAKLLRAATARIRLYDQLPSSRKRLFHKLNQAHMLAVSVSAGLGSQLTMASQDHAETEALPVSMSRFVYEEIKAIADRWPDSRVEWRDQRIVVTLGAIHLCEPDDPDESVYIGDFEILLSYEHFLRDRVEAIDAILPRNLEVRQRGAVRRIHKSKPVLPDDEGSLHPHVSDDGSVCFGKRLPYVLKMFNSLALYEVLATTEELLKSYNSEDAYEFVADWKTFANMDVCQGCKSGYCEPIKCGHFICDECMKYCDNHGCNHQCPECHSFTKCSECSDRYCEEHMYSCSNCCESVCPSCIIGCEDCGESVCRGCTQACANDCDVRVCCGCDHDCPNEPDPKPEEDEDDNDEEETDDEESVTELAGNTDSPAPSENETANADLLAVGVSEGEVCLSPSEPGS